jgi:hypothetical protein
MDEVSGDGSAEALDDGSIEIEFACHNGDEAVLKAKLDTSSTACSSGSKLYAETQPATFDIVTSTMPLGTIAYEYEANANGERQIGLRGLSGTG